MHFLLLNVRCLRCTGGLCCGTAAGGSEASLGSIYPGGAGPAGIDESYSMTGPGDDLRDLFLLCPKCVLLRHAHPGYSFFVGVRVDHWVFWDTFPKYRHKFMSIFLKWSLTTLVILLSWHWLTFRFCFIYASLWCVCFCYHLFVNKDLYTLMLCKVSGRFLSISFKFLHR